SAGVEAVRTIAFVAPGPGQWKLEATHSGRRPTTAFMRNFEKPMFEDGSVIICERYGLPLARIRMEYVNGCKYIRPNPIGEGAKPKALPPKPIMKLVVRLHPELRRRNKIAIQAWKDKRWRTELEQWFEHDRPKFISTNLALQAIVPTDLDDAALVSYVAELATHFRATVNQHGATHGADVIPMGDYLAHCQAWGIPDADAALLLRGSSPASVEAAATLAPVARAMAASKVVPRSLQEIRELGPDVGTALDAWLETYSWRLITSTDIDAPTLAERPALLFNAVCATAEIGDSVATPDPLPVRAKVPPGERQLFDELLAEARQGMRHRDDNSGICASWPAGLVRRALLEVGRRLAKAGRVDDIEHAVELSPDEIEPLLLSGIGPSANELSERADWRVRVEAADPPDFLGEPEAEPPNGIFPAPMERATNAVLAMLKAMGREPTTQSLHGTGIGTAVYRGTARVVSSSDDGLDRLEPGDVLIAPFTTPAYNTVISLVGALICEDGGAMSHAAFLSREYGIPAILGVVDATKLIPDGAIVEVDPSSGDVRIVD
ncbi:MAG: PEP-utilizing enzyme, partial [Ilumatobacteraceae bacterium]